MTNSPVLVVCLLALAAVLVATAIRRARDRARRWAAGAAGERETAAILAGLERHGFVALHDRRMPRFDRANIDHLVVGPTGVFTVETKRYAGEVRLRGIFGLGRLRPRHNGKRIDHVVDQAGFQADAAEKVLGGAPVAAVVVVHNATLGWPRLRRPVTGGVRWCAGGDNLAAYLLRGRHRLSRRQVQATADRLDRALSPAAGLRRG
jgi:hypothetical protein